MARVDLGIRSCELKIERMGMSCVVWVLEVHAIDLIASFSIILTKLVHKKFKK